VRDTADGVEEGFDGTEDKIEAGVKAMENKIKDTDNLETEYKEEKFNGEVKDI
jgi:hypothetical protein